MLEFLLSATALMLPPLIVAQVIVILILAVTVFRQRSQDNVRAAGEVKRVRLAGAERERQTDD